MHSIEPTTCGQDGDYTEKDYSVSKEYRLPLQWCPEKKLCYYEYIVSDLVNQNGDLAASAGPAGGTETVHHGFQALVEVDRGQPAYVRVRAALSEMEATTKVSTLTSIMHG